MTAATQLALPGLDDQWACPCRRCSDTHDTPTTAYGPATVDVAVDPRWL